MHFFWLISLPRTWHKWFLATIALMLTPIIFVHTLQTYWTIWAFVTNLVVIAVYMINFFHKRRMKIIKGSYPLDWQYRRSFRR